MSKLVFYSILLVFISCNHEDKSIEFAGNPNIASCGFTACETEITASLTEMINTYALIRGLEGGVFARLQSATHTPADRSAIIGATGHSSFSAFEARITTLMSVLSHFQANHAAIPPSPEIFHPTENIDPRKRTLINSLIS